MSKGRSAEYTVRPHKCLILRRTREGMVVGGDLRSLILSVNPRFVPTGRSGTINTTKYDEGYPAHLI